MEPMRDGTEANRFSQVGILAAYLVEDLTEDLLFVSWQGILRSFVTVIPR
jgi:hypothetical protein